MFPEESPPRSLSQPVVTSSSVSASEDWTTGLLGWVSSKNEGLASAENLASSTLALGAFKSESNFLGLLGLFPENGLGLTTESLLLGTIPSGSLSSLTILALLVLGNLVLDMLVARWAVCSLSFGSVHLKIHKNEVRLLADSVALGGATETGD